MVEAVSALGTTSYKVNALGQRKRKTNSLGDTVFHYDLQGRLIAETSRSGALVREYIYLGDMPVAVALPGPWEAIIDNIDAGFSSTGFWSTQEFPGKYGPDHLLSNQGSSTATWSFEVPATGTYNVYAWWTPHGSGANVTFTVNHAGGATPFVRSLVTDGGQWNLLGSFTFNQGPTYNVTQTVATAGWVTADAVRVEPVQQQASGTHYIHVDHLNTPRAIYDANQQLRWRWEQAEPFGANVPDENPSSLGALEYPGRLPGQYFDKETNLHYNYFRDYDSAIGRYIQSDPIGLDGGLNTYAYVNGSPLTKFDLLGLAAYCKKSCKELIKPIYDMLTSLNSTAYPRGKCTVKCEKLWRGRGRTIGSTVVLNESDYGEVDRDSNLITYIWTLAHELRHCRAGPLAWSGFGSSDPDSLIYNPAHGALDQEAERDAWTVLPNAQKLFTKKEPCC